MEQALNDVGMLPTVISTPDSLEGAGPLAHSGCTVVKLNGESMAMGAFGQMIWLDTNRRVSIGRFSAQAGGGSPEGAEEI